MNQGRKDTLHKMRKHARCVHTTQRQQNALITVKEQTNSNEKQLVELAIKDKYALTKECL